MSIASLDWERCRSLLAILRTGSLAAAARSLGVAHPTMRRHLDDLESALGARLFVRSPKGLVATELALALRGSAETMEAAFAHLLRTASGDAAATSGTVRITASEVIGAEALPPLLARLREVHPGLAFELHLTDVVEDLLRHDADIAVRMSRPLQSGLLARRVAVLELGLYASRRWTEAHRPLGSLDELVASGSMIGEDKATTIIDGLAAAGVAATRADFGFRSDSNLAQLAALRAGLGVGVCQVAVAARDPCLVRLLPGFSHGLEVWLASHPGQRGLARVASTLDALASGLADYARHGRDPD